MKSTWKATKTTDSTQISHFDLVFCRVQREGQLGRSYILMVFGGAHVCWLVHVCVYGACMHTHVWSFVLYNFIMDFIKSNTILLKPKWFHFMRFQMTSWNPTGFYRVIRFHKIHGSLQDYIKSRRISWNSSWISLKFTEFHRISLNAIGFHKFSWNPTQVHVKSTRFYYGLSWYISLHPTGFHTISWNPTQFY